jgi:carboxymethylenebutenolidase
VNASRIGCVGFCMGDGLSLLFACRNRDLAAAVVFYGRNPSPIDQVKNISFPILCNYAGADMAMMELDTNLLKEMLNRA